MSKQPNPPTTYRPIDDAARNGRSVIVWAKGSFYPGHWSADAGKWMHCDPDPKARPRTMKPQPTHYHPRADAAARRTD